MSNSAPVQAVAVTDEALRVRVRPWAAIRTAWKTSLINALSFVAGALLLILPYLLTVDLSAVLSPRGVIIWTMALNVATIILRAVGTKPIVLDQGSPAVVPVDGGA